MLRPAGRFPRIVLHLCASKTYAQTLAGAERTLHTYIHTLAHAHTITHTGVGDDIPSTPPMSTGLACPAKPDFSVVENFLEGVGSDTQPLGQAQSTATADGRALGPYSPPDSSSFGQDLDDENNAWGSMGGGKGGALVYRGDVYRTSSFMVLMGSSELRKDVPRLLLSAAGDTKQSRYVCVGMCACVWVGGWVRIFRVYACRPLKTPNRTAAFASVGRRGRVWVGNGGWVGR